MAININELRFGNWFLNPQGKPEQYDDYLNGEINPKSYPIYSDNQGYDESEINPISLTQEWLQKLGFEMRLINGIIPEWYIMCTPPNYKREFALRFRFGMLRDTLPGICDEQTWAPWRDSGDAHNFNIQSVHQLQNFYYLLKGEELQIK